MFSKISRYRKLPDVVTVDAKGRTLESKELRPLPEVSGTFQHTVLQGDRLDRLAFKYYDQPRKWWRICDANPEFLSPRALLGNDPLITAHLPIVLTAPGPVPWHTLLELVKSTVGVVDAMVIDEIELVPQVQTVGTDKITVYLEAPVRALEVTFNEKNITREQLSSLVETAGVDVKDPYEIGRIGKPIIIPPDTSV